MNSELRIRRAWLAIAISSVVSSHPIHAATPIQGKKPDLAIPKEAAQPADLWQAINANSLQYVQKFAKDVNAVDPLGQPALLLAAARGYADIASWLLDQGADIEVRGPRNWTPLIAATFGGHTDVVKLLLQYNASTKAVSADGLNALFYAVDYQCPDIIDVLLAAGADVNAATALEFQDGHSVLMRTAMHNFPLLAEKLLAAGARVEQTDRQSRTALIYAAQYDAVDTLAVLQRYRADLKLRDNDGNDALQVVALKGQLATAQWLAGQGLDLKIKNKAGDTALIIAARAGNTEVAKLLAEKSDKSARNDALFAAVQGGSLPTVQSLLELGLAVDSRSADGETPLMVAARSSHPHLVEYLLQQKADVKLRDREGNDALLSAVLNAYRHEGIVQQLLAAGADKFLRNGQGMSAAEILSVGVAQ
jgi:ankyrin repeat protein